MMPGINLRVFEMCSKQQQLDWKRLVNGLDGIQTLSLTELKILLFLLWKDFYKSFHCLFRAYALSIIFNI